MLRDKKYNIFSFVNLCIRMAPLQCLSIFAYTLVMALMPAYQTLTMANFVNTAMSVFSGEMSYSAIYLPIILIICYIIYTNLAPAILNLLEVSLQNKFRVVLKQEMLLKKTRLKYEHMENDSTCELMNRVFNDPVRVFFDGFKQMMAGLTIVVQCISLISIIMVSAFWAGLILLISCIPLLYLSGKTGQKNYDMDIESSKLVRKYNYLFNVLTDRDHADERKLFNYGDQLAGDYEKLYSKAEKIETKMQIKRYANMKSGSVVTIAIIIVILGFLLGFVVKGTLDVGTYVGLVGALFGLVQGMSWNLSGVMIQFALISKYLKDFSAFLNLSESNYGKSIKNNMQDFVFESIEFRDVSFRYPNTDRYILKNCSFVLNKGNSYSFVGLNGAGKTTITKLLTGLYDNYEGEILLNGRELRMYNNSDISQMFSVVFQDFAKYAVSIKDNIILGNLGKDTPEQLEKAIKFSGADNFISDLPSGVDTYVGKIFEDSIDLSGGQWQKLAIARMIYANKQINILDEPTAALDPIAEAEVYRMFSRAIKDRFTIYITHRLGAAKIADQILVLNNGRVEEQGSHEELMNKDNGLYRKMYESQRSWYVDD